MTLYARADDKPTRPSASDLNRCSIYIKILFTLRHVQTLTGIEHSLLFCHDRDVL